MISKEAPIIHEATTENPDPTKFMPIEVESAFPEGAKSVFNSQEKAQIDRFINEVPDKNDTRVINYWLDWGDKKVYLEGWIDKCLAGTGFLPMESGEWDEKIQYMVADTHRTLIEKQKERNLTLIEGGFREFDAGEKNWLYGVSWGVYKKEGAPATSTIPRWLSLEQVLGLETRFPMEKLWRDERAYLDKLTTEIEREGLTEPITIRVRDDGSLIVWDGIHRLAVAQKLRIKDIPVEFIGTISAFPKGFLAPEVAIPKAEAGTHPLILRQYPLGAVPEKITIGGLDVPVPPLRGTKLLPKKPKNIPENAVIRTKEKFDNAIKHLGYESVSLSLEELEELDKVIPTDVEIINDSQRRLRSAEVVPDEKLDSKQLAHLKLARAIAREVFPSSSVSGVHAAIIPPASDRVRTAGMYGTTTQAVYIGLDQLYRGRTTVDTQVHELAHHREYRQTGSAEDLSKPHAEAMTNVAAKVVEEVAKGTFNKELKEVTW